MLNLIIKDIIVQKNNLLIALLYPLVAILAFGRTTGSEAVYMFSIISITYIMVTGASTYDEKNPSDMLINSFPIKRRDVILSKYLSIFVFLIAAIIITYAEASIVSKLGLITGIRTINFNDIFTSSFALCLLYSIFFPLYYKLGFIKMRLLNVLMFMAAIFAPVTIMEAVRNHSDNVILKSMLDIANTIPTSFVRPVSLCLVILLLIISLNISTRIYQKKDF